MQPHKPVTVSGSYPGIYAAPSHSAGFYTSTEHTAAGVNHTSFPYRVHSRCQQPTSNPLPLLPPSTHPPHHRRAARLGCSGSLQPKSFILTPFPSFSGQVRGAPCAQPPPPPAPVRKAPRGGAEARLRGQPAAASPPRPCPEPPVAPRCRGLRQPSPGSRSLPSCGEWTLSLPCGLPAEWEHPSPRGSRSSRQPLPRPRERLSLPPSPASSEPRAEVEGEEVAGRSPLSSPTCQPARVAKYLRLHDLPLHVLPVLQWDPWPSLPTARLPAAHLFHPLRLLQFT